MFLSKRILYLLQDGCIPVSMSISKSLLVAKWAFLRPTGRSGVLKTGSIHVVITQLLRNHPVTCTLDLEKSQLFTCLPDLQAGLRIPSLYHTILYYTILYYTILYYTILYYTMLYYTILYYTILYYTILYYTILDYTVLY